MRGQWRRWSWMASVIGSLLFYAACAPVQEPPRPQPTPYPEVSRPPRDDPRTKAEWAYQQGLRAIDRGNMQEAIQFFQLAIERDPQHLRAYLSLGDVYNMQDNYLLAETYYNKVLNFDSQSVPALTALGTMQWKMGNYREAMSFYRKVLEFEPDNPFVEQQLAAVTEELFATHYEQGLAYKDAGELEAAAVEWQKALSLHPGDVEFMVDIGDLFFRIDDYMMADGYYQQALAQQPDSFPAILGAGKVQLALKHYDEAIQYFQTALSLQPGHPEASRALQRAQTEEVRQFLPQEYFAIQQVEQVTRGEIAALLVVDLMLESRLPSPSRLAIISDITTHWAKPYIIKAVQYGIMQVFTDRSFLPYDPIHKGRLAFVLDNLFRTLGVALPEGGAVTFSDVHQDNLYYNAIRRIYAAGIMTAADETHFGINATLDGEEVMHIFEKVKRLLR